jgi:hypothetical protein
MPRGRLQRLEERRPPTVRRTPHSIWKPWRR